MYWQPANYRIVDDVPVAIPDNAGVVQAGDTLNVNAAGGVLSNDDFGADDVTAVTALSGGTLGVPQQGSHGSLTLETDGSYAYTANAGAAGVDVFTYEITDGDGDTSTATLTFTVNDGPTAEPNDPGTDPEDTVVDEADGDLDGQGAVFTAVSVDGNVTDNDDFGGDGSGSPPIFDVTYDNALGTATKDSRVPGPITFTATAGNWTLVVYTTDATANAALGGQTAGYYVFTQTDEFDHAVVQGTNSADGVFTYTIEDGNGDQDSSTLTIRIVDDVETAVQLVGVAVSDRELGAEHKVDLTVVADQMSHLGQQSDLVIVSHVAGAVGRGTRDRH